MNIAIRPVGEPDRQLYKKLVQEFYSSDAVLHSIPDVHIDRTFCELMRSDAYAIAYIIECDGNPAGYTLLARHFSQEAGGEVIWIEELYLLPDFRGMGVGTKVFAQLFEKYPASAFRLEIEPDNKRAAALYARLGFEPLGYSQMTKPAHHM